MTHQPNWPRVSIAVVLASGALLAACSQQDDNATAGQKLDATVADAQEMGAEVPGRHGLA